MVGFFLMIAGVFGLYAKGNQWANAPKPADPVLTEIMSLSERFSTVEQQIHDIDSRVTHLEKKDASEG